MAFQCAICDEAFMTKAELSRHAEAHFCHTTPHFRHTAPTGLLCGVCKWDFDDSHALELHQRQTGHGTTNFFCDRCNQRFISQESLDDHRKPPSGRANTLKESEEMAVFCDRCEKSFSNQKRFSEHRSNLANACADWRHTPPNKQPQSASKDYIDLDKPKDDYSQAINSYDDPAQQSDASTNTSNGGLRCKNCKKRFQSQGHYNNHFLACTPAESRLQSDHVIETHKGLLRAPSGPAYGHKGSSTLTRSPQPLAFRPPKVPPGERPAPAQHRMPPFQASGAPTITSMGSAADMEQAKQIQVQALRLLIQSDIFIHYDGGMTVGGICWTRISVAKQPEVVGTLDNMCHLPKMLQGEYVPAPKTFMDEYKAYYDLADFESCPARDPGKPCLGVIALSCSKVVLEGGRLEVVKIAAIDLVTCGILMNHLVCTDPRAHVTDWRPTVTGISSWLDMEAARQAGYKIFKGWSAARVALQKYVDSGTIIVGHNLRSNLDALRIVHGRAIDIAKVVEKAANGPLSKAQLALDSLCRDYTERNLPNHAVHGRDCLVNAFAIREFVLWTIKNKEKLGKIAKQKSLDYQRIRPAGYGTIAP
ncbi:hypothetical protein J3E72DRAFT_184129 [Bipolaris maydis]|nr:hypothetical protein J3E74DRAFT_202181 [Bipolaris maydis]KAJ6201139.1 hypothetical protein J3E72DRAFT_184129 [Bipolaris maydis]KAJ6212987.1 hypothetical protein PSV09DRAFT_2231717 [Bipolaris maydis]